MKVVIPGYLAPTAAARIEIEGKPIILRPKDRWPIFEEGAPETKGIEHLLAPLTVDFPAEPIPEPAPAAHAAAGDAKKGTKSA